MLDAACLFQIVVRLPYEDLWNMIKAINKPYVYSIINSDHFMEEWKKYNITIKVIPHSVNETIRKEVDTFGYNHGFAHTYTADGICYSIAKYHRDRLMSYTEWCEQTLNTSNPIKDVHIEYNYVGRDRYEYMINWHIDGSLKSKVHCKNSCFDGLSLNYFEDGKITLDHYPTFSGRRLHINWFSNGQREYMKFGDNPCKVTTWFENGFKKSYTAYRDGRKHGLRQLWTDEGILLSSNNYVDGVLEVNVK